MGWPPEEQHNAIEPGEAEDPELRERDLTRSTNILQSRRVLFKMKIWML